MPKRHEIVTDDGKCLDFSRNAPLGDREPRQRKATPIRDHPAAGLSDGVARRLGKRDNESALLDALKQGRHVQLSEEGRALRIGVLPLAIGQHRRRR